MKDTTTHDNESSSPQPASKVHTCTVAAGVAAPVTPEQESIAPHPVIRGADLHQPSTRIDWARFTLPFYCKNQITYLLEKHFGPYNDKLGMWGYAYRHQFAFDAFVTFTDNYRECCVELSGTACEQLGSDKLFELLTWANDNEGTATRLDIAADFQGEQLELIDNVRQACEAKQLCRCRKWKPEEPRTADGDYTGRGVNMGVRGKNGSGRYIRVYDKGLETGTSPARTWERWEVEFSKEHATEAMRELLQSTDRDRTALNLAFGAVEFREWTGSRSSNVDRWRSGGSICSTAWNRYACRSLAKRPT